MVQITIDGKSIQVPERITVLQATRMAGVDIPTLCDHPALKPYGGCRLCVVEVEGMRTLQASCTLPVYEGMVVHIDTPKVHKAREFVLSLLFSERNHFCMYCQKSGGDCELQNAAYGEEMTHWPLQPDWKPFALDASHPTIAIDHNRCILCRRCVRACSDLVGTNTLGIENRGAISLLVADAGVPFGESSCIRCGTCVQICPTGALIDRPSAYLGLASQARRIQSICVGCSVGCGIELLAHDNQLVRIEGDWEAGLNGGVLCELGRYTPLMEKRDRIRTPLIKKNASQVPATWAEALDSLASRLLPLKGRNGDGIAALASTRLPAEALFAFRELFSRQLASPLVTSIEEDATYAGDFSQIASGTLEALKESDCVVVIGADLVKSHQVAGFFVKRRLAAGTRLVVIDPYENEMSEFADYALRLKPDTDLQLLGGIMSAIENFGLDKRQTPGANGSFSTSLETASRVTGIPVETISAVGVLIGAAQKPVFVYGKGLTSRHDKTASEALSTLAQMVAGALINPMGKANSLAALRYGLHLPFELQDQKVVYLALGDDFPTPRLVEQVEEAQFLVVQTSYTSALSERADIVLPVEIWAEQDGHYLNLEGRLQDAHKALQAPAEIWSNVEVLEALAEKLDVQIDDQWEAGLANGDLTAVFAADKA
jgi:formate dehydrogenase major subunit